MKTEPQKEHEWLKKLVGEWTYESECSMEPGKPPEKFKGSETARSLDGLWVLCEGQGEMPGGGMATTLMTLGYDPQKKQYVGTWVGSMMSHLWVYDGSLDAGEKVLTLNAEGPSCAGDGKVVKYKDVIEVKSDDHRVLTSHMLGDDGNWHQFMTANYRRTKKLAAALRTTGKSAEPRGEITMITSTIPHPKIVSRDEWLAARRNLLEHEKDVTKHRDRVNAERRHLPMVTIEKDYVFGGPEGKQSLKDLFDGRRQLIVYHFMFDPQWDKGCLGCTGYVDALGDLSMLNDRDTTFVLVSRAPLAKLEAYKAFKGWSVPWVSSFGSDFNYDFHVTLDENVAPIEYNYRDKAEMEARQGPNVMEGEEHGLSVFFRVEKDVFHTYSTYARGTEALTDAYGLLDTTPYGRHEDFEDSPPGWPQKPTYG